MDNITDTKKTIPDVRLPSRPPRRIKPQRLLEKKTAVAALKQAFVMLRPDIQWKNPVMFVVEVGAFLTLVIHYRGGGIMGRGGQRGADKLFYRGRRVAFFDCAICEFCHCFGRGPG